MKKLLGFVDMIIHANCLPNLRKKAIVSKNLIIHIYFNKLKICIKIRIRIDKQPRKLSNRRCGSLFLTACRQNLKTFCY